MTTILVGSEKKGKEKMEIEKSENQRSLLVGKIQARIGQIKSL